MYTIIETPNFQKKIDKIFTTDERLEFISYLAKNSLKGDVIKNGKGLRKIRWNAKGKGKSGGVRIIYYNLLDDGYIYCLDIYAKNKKENLSANEIQQLTGKKS